MAAVDRVTLTVAGREVSISNPGKVYFPAAGITKLEVVNYYLAVAEGAVRGVAGRPMALKRYVNGIDQPFFFQKRAPEKRPEWVDVVELAFPSGRTAWEVVIRDAAQLAWVANLGCIDLNPHPVRTDDLEHPDELRVDLDPGPGVPWSDVREVALVAREALAAVGLEGFPKTSGSRGIHVYARIERRFSFTQVRRAALAIARDVERRAPAIATSKWWKEERHGVFLDYNQNAKDRTVASAYSVRPLPDGRVSAPLRWDEVPACEPADFTLRTMPVRFAAIGDPAAGLDAAIGSLDAALELFERQGQGEAPWPPHYPKTEDEPERVQPSRSRARRAATAAVGAPAEPGAEPPARRPGTSRRQSKMPLLEIAKAERQADALAGLDRWKARHPSAAAALAVDDVLVDMMRGRSSVWWRVRVNLRHVPEAERPPQEPLDPDYDPWAGMRGNIRKPRGAR